jgi:hypothetical protein
MHKTDEDGEVLFEVGLSSGLIAACCSPAERDRALDLQLLPRIVRPHKLLHLPRSPDQAARLETDVQGTGVEQPPVPSLFARNILGCNKGKRRYMQPFCFLHISSTFQACRGFHSYA